MRSKEVEEAISDFVNTKENRLYDEICSNDIKSIKTVLSYIETLEQLPNKIRDKIKELMEMELDNDDVFGQMRNYAVLVLKELLEKEK